jgi:GTP-binding protein
LPDDRRAFATADGAFRIVSAEFLAGAGPGCALPGPTQIEFAFAGRSNVGKSSLINTLLSRKSLVRTSSTPGSTRQLNLYEARAADGTVYHLVDLPGYGFTRRSKAEQSAWVRLIEGYLEHRATLAAVVMVVDVRRGIEDDDRELTTFIGRSKNDSRRPVQIVVAATKLDKIPRSSRKMAVAQIAKASGAPVVGFSSETGEGRDDLWRALRRLASGALSPLRPTGP